jgi:hypothetical protein
MTDFLISAFLNWYRAAHGAGKVKNSNGLDYAAYEATEAVCKYGRGKMQTRLKTFQLFGWF